MSLCHLLYNCICSSRPSEPKSADWLLKRQAARELDFDFPPCAFLHNTHASYQKRPAQETKHMSNKNGLVIKIGAELYMFLCILQVKIWPEKRSIR